MITNLIDALDFYAVHIEMLRCNDLHKTIEIYLPDMTGKLRDLHYSTRRQFRFSAI